MKKLCFLLILALLLSLGASAGAEGGVEIIIMDGVSVVAVSMDEYAAEHVFGEADFVFPSMLLTIWDGAFEGISAERVKVSTNVSAIGARAFADCPNLTAILIPATVESIDNTALQGSEQVTVFGTEGSEAQRFADDNDIPFVPLHITEDEAEFFYEELEPPIILPLVLFD